MIKVNHPSTLPSECQGYEIIFSYKVGENTHAIGHNGESNSPYIVWYYTPINGFFWGKYADSFEKAMTSLLERVRLGDIKNLKNHGGYSQQKRRESRE